MGSRSVVSISCACLLVVVTLGFGTSPASAFPGRGAHGLHWATPCPVTQPNGEMPPGSGNPEYIGGYGNDALWTNVWMWGKGPVPVKADPTRPGRTAGPGKWAWYRYVPGDLTIEGRRLDGEAPPLRAHVLDGYGSTGLQVTGISFPTPGCWAVTGRVGDASLTFIVRVVLVD